MALIAGLADERKGGEKVWKYTKMAKFTRKCFAKKGTTVVKILGNHKILGNIRETEKSQAIFAKIC